MGGWIGRDKAHTTERALSIKSKQGPMKHMSIAAQGRSMNHTSLIRLTLPPYNPLTCPIDGERASHASRQG